MNSLRYIVTLCILLCGVIRPAAAENVSQGEDTDVKQIVFSHIGDSYSWHITSWGHTHLNIPLPVIVRNHAGDWFCFLSSRIDEGASYEGFRIATEGAYAGKIVEEVNGTEIRPIDLSITKTVFALLLNSLILICIILGVARWYKKRKVENAAPGGFVGAMEMFIMMIHDDLIKSCVGKDYKRFAPYLLTVFFFIFLNNLMGLIPIFPGGANVTGNIAITLVLALCTFVITNIFGTREYWKDIFGMAQMSGTHDARHRIGRHLHQTVCTDDSSFCQHDGRPCSDPEPHLFGIRLGEYGCGSQCVDDRCVGTLLRVYEPARTAGGLHPSLRIYDAVGRLHRIGPHRTAPQGGGKSLKLRINY